MTPAESYFRIVEEIQKTHPKPTLVAVSKGRSLAEIESLYLAGCRDFGESRVQEFLSKLEVLPKDIRWHFIGPLQKNKVSKLVGKCHLIHSVDSVELAEKIGKQSVQLEIITRILLQVNISGESSKQGFSLEEVLQKVGAIYPIQGIKVEGLMTIAPLTGDKEKISMYFQALRDLRDRLKLIHLSMGMSQDYQLALERGATLIRLGSVIFS